MDISVIIPTYNRASFITNTINSVLNQTYQPKEIIVVDDGSSDDTQEILSKLTKTNPIIKYIKQSNQGVSGARNLGIKNSSYEWIAFLDSDDIWCETKLETQTQLHKQNKNILFSHTNELWLFNGKVIKQKKHQQKYSGYCFEQNLENTLIGASTVMIHRSIFEDVGYFDESLKVCEDYDMWLRILEKYEVQLCEQNLIKKIAGHKGQLSFETPMIDSYRVEVLLKHIENPKYKDIVRKHLKRKIDIILKGAYKYDNKPLIEKYEKLLTDN